MGLKLIRLLWKLLLVLCIVEKISSFHFLSQRRQAIHFHSKGFVVTPPPPTTRSTQLFAIDSNILLSLLQRVDPIQAKSEFFFFFFGGSGALGLGFKQIPSLFDEVKKIQQLKGGITNGGELLEINPLATIGYPEPLKKADILDIIENVPSVETISRNGPKRGYLAQKGLLERDGFIKSLPNKNPLAVYAVYDAISKGGGDLASPIEANDFLVKWKKEGIESFKKDLTAAILRKYAAYGVFFFLIAVVLDLIVESGINAFL